MTDRFLPMGESNHGKFTITVQYLQAPDGWVEELYREIQAVIRNRQGEPQSVNVSVDISSGFGAYDGQ